MVGLFFLLHLLRKTNELEKMYSIINNNFSNNNLNNRIQIEKLLTMV